MKIFACKSTNKRHIGTLPFGPLLLRFSKIIKYFKTDFYTYASHQNDDKCPIPSAQHTLHDETRNGSERMLQARINMALALFM